MARCERPLDRSERSQRPEGAQISIFTIFTDIATIAALARIQARILDEIKELLTEIRNALAPKPAIRGRILVNGRVIPMGFQLQDVQKVTATFQFTDADGNPTPAPAGAAPQWASSDVTKATVAASADGLSATIAGQPVLGDVQINVTEPSTTPPITASSIITIVAGPPAGGTIAFGTPTP